MDRFSMVFKEMERLAEPSDGEDHSLISFSQQVASEAREVAELRRMVAEVNAPKPEYEYYSGT